MTDAPKRSILFSPAAEGDLLAIRNYLVEEAGVGRAEIILSRIRAQCGSLGHLPERFPAVGYAVEPLRVCRCESWHIFYRLAANVEIVRIIHQARDVRGEMLR